MSEAIGKQVEGKKMCPTCHQVINSRVIRVRKAHISALIKAVQYMARHQTKTFAIRDIAEEAKFTPTEYGNFNELKRMLPSMVSGRAGEYTFNNLEVMNFLTGGSVIIEFLVTAGHKDLQPLRFGTLDDIKGTGEFIQNNKWITEYRRPELELSQLSLV